VATPEAECAARVTDQVRHHLSLLQGYADLLDGLSPQLNVQILRVMAEKIGELTEAVRPFIQPGREERPSIEEYREARRHNRQLMADYRLLLKRLRDSVAVAQDASPPG
jgi:hypothetical protein